MLKKYFSIMAVTVLLAWPVHADEIAAVCTGVVDGDTLLATANGQQYTVKLAYIVAPTLKQEFGTEAKQYLEELALKQRIRIIVTSSTSEDITAEVYSPAKQDPVNRELIRKGLAWPVPGKSARHPYELSVRMAKKRRLGVWSVQQMKPPGQEPGSAETQGGGATGTAAPAASAEPQSSSSGGRSSNLLFRQRQNVNSFNEKTGMPD